MCVEFDPRRKKVMVRDGRGKELRFINLRKITTCRLRTTGSGGTLMALRIEGEVDLVGALFLELCSVSGLKGKWTWWVHSL